MCFKNHTSNHRKVCEFIRDKIRTSEYIAEQMLYNKGQDPWLRKMVGSQVGRKLTSQDMGYMAAEPPDAKRVERTAPYKVRYSSSGSPRSFRRCREKTLESSSSIRSGTWPPTRDSTSVKSGIVSFGIL